MYEHDFDNLFDRFRADGPLVGAAGPDAARAVHRHRQRVRVAAAGVLTVALIAVPAVALAIDHAPDRVAPPITDSTVEPLPSTPAPSASPSPTATSPSAAPPPDGRISKEDLGNADLDLPAWLAPECPSGRVGFSGGRAGHAAYPNHEIVIYQVVHADVDRDGAEETAALISCEGPEMIESRVFALDRTESGSIATMGLVVGETGDPWPTTDSISDIRRIRGSGSAVEVEVADFGKNGVPLSLAQHQWRAYSWNGDRFVQTGGPTAFPPNPKVTDLSVAGQVLRMGCQPASSTCTTAAATGRQSGTLTLTVRNNGPFPAAQPRVDISLWTQLTVTRVSSGCSTPASSTGRYVTCKLGELKVGSEVELVISVAAPACICSGTVGTYRASVTSTSDYNGPAYPEPDGKGADNSIERDVVVS